MQNYSIIIESNVIQLIQESVRIETTSINEEELLELIQNEYLKDRQNTLFANLEELKKKFPEIIKAITYSNNDILDEERTKDEIQITITKI